LLLAELLRLFAHELAQLFDFLTIILGRFGGFGFVGFGFRDGRAYRFIVAAAVAGWLPRLPCSSRPRKRPAAKSAQMSAADNILLIRFLHMT